MDPKDPKRIPRSVIRAFYERHRTRFVPTVITDVDSVRVDPAAPGSPTPPWLRTPPGPKHK
jgi:hypothetical protein